jgi:N-acetylmuramoyl-L-alanine amidase
LCNAIDSKIPKQLDEKINVSSKKGYIVTTYLPNGNNGDGSFQGVDLNYVLNYFQGIKCYARGNEKGVWIESQYLDMDKCLELKEKLGSLFYAIN